MESIVSVVDVGSKGSQDGSKDAVDKFCGAVAGGGNRVARVVGFMDFEEKVYGRCIRGADHEAEGGRCYEEMRLWMAEETVC